MGNYLIIVISPMLLLIAANCISTPTGHFKLKLKFDEIQRKARFHWLFM